MVMQASFLLSPTCQPSALPACRIRHAVHSSSASWLSFFPILQLIPGTVRRGPWIQYASMQALWSSLCHSILSSEPHESTQLKMSVLLPARDGHAGTTAYRKPSKGLCSTNQTFLSVPTFSTRQLPRESPFFANPFKLC